MFSAGWSTALGARLRQEARVSHLLFEKVMEGFGIPPFFTDSQSKTLPTSSEVTSTFSSCLPNNTHNRLVL